MRIALAVVSVLLVCGVQDRGQAAAPRCNEGPIVVSGTLSRRALEEPAGGTPRTRFILNNPTCGDGPIEVSVQGILACREGQRVMVRGRYAMAAGKPLITPATASCGGAVAG
jgi:hypothetical protein